jgi:hypothetical protein
MEPTNACASTNEADQVICALFGPKWEDTLTTKEGKILQQCERCKKCQRTKPDE